MATLTPNIGLKKPAGSEYPKISDAVNDNADILDANIAKLQEGIAIIVDGDTAAVAVPVGGYAYIKNNQHELTDGLYKNTSSSAFPVSGGTADSTVFTAVPAGAVNDAVSAINGKIGSDTLPTTAQTLTGAIVEHENDLGSLNDNIAKVQNGLAYIVGDTNTTGETLAAGQFVYVKGHATIPEGLRKVTASISANGSITTNNTEACPEGGLNALKTEIENIENAVGGDAFSESVSANTMTTVKSVTLSAGRWFFVSYMDLSIGISDVYINRISNDGNDQTVRTTGENGGGSVNVKLISVASSTVVEVKAYVSTACTVRGNVFYFKLI